MSNFYNIDNFKRQTYYCNKCKRRHYQDTKIGQAHFGSKMSIEQQQQTKEKEFEKKYKGKSVEMQIGGVYRPVKITGKRKPHYIEVQGKGWVHQSLIFFPGGKFAKETKRYELKPGEKGFWEK